MKYGALPAGGRNLLCGVFLGGLIVGAIEKLTEVFLGPYVNGGIEGVSRGRFGGKVPAWRAPDDPGAGCLAPRRPGPRSSRSKANPASPVRTCRR